MKDTSCRKRIEQLMTEDVIVARVAALSAANGYDYSAMLEMMVVALTENRAHLTDQLARAYANMSAPPIMIDGTKLRVIEDV
jgi:hypothetical protein